MSKNKPKIIVDVERMKHPFTGLYYYCLNLAENLEKYHADTFDFHFFAYPKVPFPKHLKRMNRSQLDKFYLTKAKKYKLWHATWQDTKYVPKNNMKFVYTIHDLNFLYTDKPEFKKKKLLQAVQDKIDRADAITVISNFVKEDVEKHLDTRGKTIDVIYNGVEVNEYPDFDSPSYKPSKKFLFSVGTVLYKKHFHVLPRLLADNDFELIIGGIHPDKSYIDQIWKEADKYGVKDRVKLVGPITDEEKYWYTKNAEAFLFPSISEGFGLPPIEAMRLGKPVFLSRLTSLPEVGGKFAYYFQNFEPEHMREVLKNGLKDYHDNDRKEEIIKWSEQFNWEKATSEYVEVYKRVLDIQQETSIPQKKKISAIILTYNEEKNIKEALEQVIWADEILIIDSHSTDKTIEIAQGMQKVKIIKRKFDNFSSQKNFAIQQAANDWIISIDADERFSTDLKNEINKILEKGPENEAYWVRRKNFIKNKEIKFSGWQNDKVIRLFNKKFCKYNGKPVHEEIECRKKIGYLQNPIYHYTYEDENSFKEKIFFYSKIKAQLLYEKQLKPNFFHFTIKPAYRFLYHYVYKLGFLDGKSGFIISKINAEGIYMRYKYLKQMYK